MTLPSSRSAWVSTRLAALTICALSLLVAQPASAALNKKDPTEAAVFKLEHAQHASERVRAAITIAEHPESVSSKTLTAMIASLYGDGDPLVRRAVASALGEIAHKQEKGVAPGKHEPMMLEALSVAFAAERDPAVRRSIASSAGQFNHPNAANLLRTALTDLDPSVRVAAQKAKLKRDQRLIKLVTG